MSCRCALYGEYPAIEIAISFHFNASVYLQYNPVRVNTVEYGVSYYKHDFVFLLAKQI